MGKPQNIILFTLSGLVILTVVAILSANLGFPPGAQQSQLAKWGPAGVLVEIITLFGFVAKALFGKRYDKRYDKPSLVIGPPEKPPAMREFDITRIGSTKRKC